MSDDRREADHAWKLDITKQLSAAETKIDRLQIETEKQTEKIDELHTTVETALYGNSSDKGLSNKYFDLVQELEDLKKMIFKVLPWVALGLIIVGDRLSPLIFDYIYEKTHIKLFYSPVQEFKEEKQTTHIKHYHIFHLIAEAFLFRCHNGLFSFANRRPTSSIFLVSETCQRRYKSKPD